MSKKGEHSQNNEKNTQDAANIIHCANSLNREGIADCKRTRYLPRVRLIIAREIHSRIGGILPP